MSEHPRQLERVDWSPSREHPPDLSAWPYSIPAVAQLIAEGGLVIPPGITFLVGENGSGKSTLVEALAAVYPRRGFATPFVDKLGPAGSAEDSPLLYNLRARTHPRASPVGFFLRAEAMHQYLAGIDADPGQAGSWGEEELSTQSHASRSWPSCATASAMSASTSWTSPRRRFRSGRASR